jgi:hypothetical protein
VNLKFLDMKKKILNKIPILIGFLSVFLFAQCQKDKEPNSSFTFPEITNIDPSVYNEIKITCEKRWDLNKMIDSTFKIVADGDEYSVRCEGYIENQIYIFEIRVDSNGKWINDGYTLKK